MQVIKRYLLAIMENATEIAFRIFHIWFRVVLRKLVFVVVRCNHNFLKWKMRTEDRHQHLNHQQFVALIKPTNTTMRAGIELAIRLLISMNYYVGTKIQKIQALSLIHI